ncbi:MAG: ATP-binding protein [Candidatus Xenobiia bacterium LiM19]
MNYSRFLDIFVYVLTGITICVMWYLALTYPFPHIAIMALFTVILCALTSFKIKIPRVANEISVTWPVTFFGLWLWGPWIGLTLMIAVLLYICNQIRQEWSLFREYLRDYVLSTLYNLSYCCLITCVPAIVYYKAGGLPGFSTPAPGVLLACFISAMLCYIISSILTNIRIALFENQPPWKLFIDYRSELMELSLVSFSIIGIPIFCTLGVVYLFLLTIPIVLGLYFLNFAIKVSTEKDDINVLLHFARIINSSLNREITLENIAREAMNSVNADGCALFLRAIDTRKFSLQFALGALQNLALDDGSEFHTSLGASILSFREKVSSYRESESIKSQYFPSISGEISLAPFHEKQNITGFLLLSKNQFERDHRNFLSILISQAGTAISNAGLYLQALNTYEQLKAIQAQLVQSSKMSAVGQLAAGVAHRLSGPIKTIVKNFNKVSSGVEKTEKLERRLNISQKALIRCIDIHDKLLHYTQKPETGDTEIDVPLFIEENIELLARLLEKDNIKVVAQCSPCRPYKGSADYLSQVITNMILNSRDAVTASAETDKRILISSREEDDRLFISVKDNGTGMSDEVRERIFEPFFSTKDIGMGTGLGLSVSLEIIKRSGGMIHVDSEIGKGSTFTIELPYHPDSTEEDSLKDNGALLTKESRPE